MDDAVSCKDVIDYYAGIKQTKICQLLKRKWTVLKEMAYVLGIPYKATVALQSRSLTLSDVFGIWLEMELHLKACCSQKKFKTDLPKQLLSTASERKDVIYNNPFMSSSIFLDPRFRNQIVRDEIKMQKAKTTLAHVWRRLLVLCPAENIIKETSANDSNTSKNSGTFSFEYDSNSAVDCFLSGEKRDGSMEANVSKPSEIDIEHLL